MLLEFVSRGFIHQQLDSLGSRQLDSLGSLPLLVMLTLGHFMTVTLGSSGQSVQVANSDIFEFCPHWLASVQLQRQNPLRQRSVRVIREVED